MFCFMYEYRMMDDSLAGWMGYVVFGFVGFSVLFLVRSMVLLTTGEGELTFLYP